ncbi:nuclear transport factor 2 family protein [Carboxylicivirga sp. A043]|uniref:nuclear transport factor 2 family protein n=1 Tax=Carboxylicivirga litoralis TaxID=2816963 RepID=UPI0021CB6B8D|nr:nuclear transport factor 2 family protein [Carboxylicivirga sp. A043]MCU4157084.1 nuclear transport factor 2 family protein [Carboxylicivirga sp. A043]
MKPLLLSLTFILSLSFVGGQAQNEQQEVESTMLTFIQCFLDKDHTMMMTFWNKSDDIVCIVDNKTYNTEQLSELYTYYFESIESVEILEQSFKVTPLGKYKALCIWQGKEKIKMKGHEQIESSWNSSLVMENKKGGWVIIHCHTSHY